LHIFLNTKKLKKKLVPYVTAVTSERRRHLANVIAIAKAFANSHLPAHIKNGGGDRF